MIRFRLAIGRASRCAKVARRAALLVSALLLAAFSATAAEELVYTDRPNAMVFPEQDAKYLRLVITKTNSGSEACIDELEVYAADGEENLALASNGARAEASSCLAGYPAHKVEHLNDGLYGNQHSWVAGTCGLQWAQIELPGPVKVGKIVFSRDRERDYCDRMPISAELMLSTDGETWRTVAKVDAVAGPVALRASPGALWGTVPDPPAPPVAHKAGRGGAETHEDLQLCEAFVAEEHAWLKTHGRADISSRLVPYNGRVKEYPRHVGDDFLPLPALSSRPVVDADFDDPCWAEATRGVARVAHPNDFGLCPLVQHELSAGVFGEGLFLRLRVDRLLSSHLAVVSAADGQGVGVVVYTPNGVVFNIHGQNRELVKSVPLESAFDPSLTCFEMRLPLDLFPDCHEVGLRVGMGMGGKHTDKTGRPVFLSFAPFGVAQEGECVAGEFRVRLTASNGAAPVRVRENASALADGLVLAPGESVLLSVAAEAGPIGPGFDLVLNHDGHEYALHMFRYDPVENCLNQMEGIVERLAAKGLDVERERRETASLRALQERLMSAKSRDHARERAAFHKARIAKRRVFMREPDLSAAQSLLFVKRMPFEPSHNYSVILDAPFRPGGGVFTLSIPLDDGRLDPARAEATELFNAGAGIARTPMADFDLDRIYFAYRPSVEGYFHVMSMGVDGSGLRQITDGPFHDYWPCPLPDGGLAFISTRCNARFLCWRPQAAVMFRMNADGGDMRPLSYANLSEWAPSVMRDGRIIWTRSEYQDKGADFGHTLWAIRPDGAQPELVFGNTIIQPNGYANGREVPGTSEICCTLISHFGDLNGPIALVDTSLGRFNPEAIKSITPEVPWPGYWPNEECFRDPVPIARDYFVCSHAPRDRFELFVIDRYGNRELLYGDPSISCMCPTVLERAPMPPALAGIARGDTDYGEFVMRDVYQGLEPAIQRGTVKYIRVVEEVRANLELMSDGKYRSDHPDFLEWYASPVHLVSGPHGWPTYVAKAPCGVVPVEEDGSAHFKAPAGKVLYFQALDKDFNELQRMRSVVQLQPGEKRGCIGCHEQRQLAPANARRIMATGPRDLDTPPWAGKAFSFSEVVQPVLDRNCAKCHDGQGDRDAPPADLNLTGVLDNDKVPASYRTLITKGLVHYADMGWNSGGCEKLPPLSLGTVKSRLWEVLNAGHHDVRLTEDEERRFKTWIDLNCPLWSDYTHRPERPDNVAGL